MWKLGCFSQEKHLRLHLLSIKCYCCLGETIEVLQKRHQWPHKLQRNEHNATEYLYRSTKNKVVSYLGDAHWPLITSYRRTPMKPVCTMMMMMSLPGTFDSSITNKPHTTLIIGALWILMSLFLLFLIGWPWIPTGLCSSICFIITECFGDVTMDRFLVKSYQAPMDAFQHYKTTKPYLSCKTRQTYLSWHSGLTKMSCIHTRRFMVKFE